MRFWWLDGACVLDLRSRDPEPLAPGDVQYMANMNLAHTPRGPRLLQVDPSYAIARAERGAPIVEAFDAEAWGNAAIEPVYPIAASFCVGDVTLPALRFACLPDTLAFQGTERLGDAS